MPVGLICAIPQELVHMRDLLDHGHSSEIGGARFDHGHIDGRDVVLAEAGIGKVNNTMVATLLADRFAADIIVFSGVAGGLDPALHIGDVVIADRTVQHDCGVIEDERLLPYQAGHVPFFNPTDRYGYDVPADLLDRVRTAIAGLELPPLPSSAGGSGRPAQIVFGAILSGDQYIHCEATRARLHKEHGGMAVEMEGAAVAQMCERFGLPWLDIRALSDLAGADSRFDFATFADAVAESSARIMRRLLPVL